MRIVELGSGVGWLGMFLAHNLQNATVLCTEQRGGGALQWLQHNIAENTHLQLSGLQTAVCDWQDFAPAAKCATSKIVQQQCACAAHNPDKQGNEHASAAAAQHGSSAQHGNHVQQAGSHQDRATSAATCEAKGLQPGSCRRFDFVIGADLLYTADGVSQLPCVFAALADAGCNCILYAHTKRRFEQLDQEFFQGLREAGLQWEEVREPWAPLPPPSPPPFAELFPEMRIAVYNIRKLLPA